MTDAERNTSLARRMIDLYNAGTAEWVDACHDPISQWREMPTSAFPLGRSGGRDALRRAAEESVRLVPDRRAEILGLVADRSRVALELDWVGTPAASIGDTHPKGARVRLRVAMFLTFSDGRVVGQIEYPVVLSGVDTRRGGHEEP